jgi:hypothetical protein
MENRGLTFGEKLVGLTFNPLTTGNFQWENGIKDTKVIFIPNKTGSGDEKVQRVKELCAELADILEESKEESFNEGTFNTLYEKLYNHSVGEILNAQMNVVKVLTLKY